MQDTYWNLYRSPQNAGDLEYVGESLKSGTDSYPVKNGIPHFLRFDPVETLEISRQLDRLNQQARETNWRAALAEIYGPSSGMYQYVSDPRRAIYLDLLPIDSQSNVLEIGPGLGQFTPLLASKANHVWALEVVSGQAEFAAERCRQEGLRNVSVACGGDDCRLPYASNSFDVVVINLVFEWCASRDTAESPIDGQTRLLAEIFRVLKPGGLVYLSTKNRYALRLLLGGGDEHAFNIRFGSALPRTILKYLSSFKHEQCDVGLLHSYPALHRMLRDCGLEEIRPYWAMPEMRFPVRMVPADVASIREARRSGLPQGNSRKTKFIMPWIPAKLVKYVTAGLTFTGRKPRG